MKRGLCFERKLVGVPTMALIVGMLLAVNPTNAEAQLQFVPDEPLTGAEIQVEYRPQEAMPPAETLRLRARFRTRVDAWYNRGPRQHTAAHLIRGEDGTFRGSFRVPADVVFASFAVEDLAGGWIDHNGRTLWEILVHDDRGKPLFHALEQRIADLMGRDWVLVHETARRMVELYPESVRSWQRLAFFERQVIDPSALDSLQEVHERRLLAFHAELSAQSAVDSDEIDALMAYHHVAGLEEAETWRYWRDRLDEEHPGHPAVLMYIRENGLNRTFRREPDRYLAAVEPLWQKLSERRITEEGWRWAMANNALNMAVRADDPSRFLDWIERFRNLRSSAPNTVAMQAARVVNRADLRPHALSIFREQLIELQKGADPLRPLDRPAPAHEMDTRESMSEILGMHARGLLLEGDTVAAVDTLRVATEMSWRSDNWRTLGQTLLATGDTSGAIRAFGALAADPGTAPAFADSVRIQLGRALNQDEWEAAVESARRSIVDLVLGRAERRLLTESITVRDGEGRERNLQYLADGRPLVIVFWSRHCAWSLMALPAIQRAASWAAERNSRLVVLAPHTIDEEIVELIRGRIDDPPGFGLYADDRREASRAFRNFGTPVHYVVDENGNVVFEGRGADDLDRIPIQLTALMAAAS